MSVGFDKLNLDATVKKVMSLAQERDQQTIWLPGHSDTRTFQLDSEDQVREYLMSRAELAYENSSTGLIAQIRDVVYASIGVVFETNSGEMHPPPVTRFSERPAHLAYFWQLLY